MTLRGRGKLIILLPDIASLGTLFGASTSFPPSDISPISRTPHAWPTDRLVGEPAVVPNATDQVDPPLDGGRIRVICRLAGLPGCVQQPDEVGQPVARLGRGQPVVEDEAFIGPRSSLRRDA